MNYEDIIKKRRYYKQFMNRLKIRRICISVRYIGYIGYYDCGSE